MNRVNVVLKRKPYLVNIKLGYDVVKECVQIIEQFHNLMRITIGDYAFGSKLIISFADIISLK